MTAAAITRRVETPITADDDQLGQAVYEAVWEGCAVVPWRDLPDHKRRRYVWAGRAAQAAGRGGA